LPVDSPGVPRYGLGMCISPDELSNEELLSSIARMRGEFQESTWMIDDDKKYYARRAELYEQILKERAEAGTYADH
jgi:hypothetical protein